MIKQTHIIFIENPSPSAGGIQNMAYWIACELAKKKYHVVVIGDCSKIPESLFEYDNVELFESKKIRSKYFSDFYTALILFKIRIKYGKNVVFYAMLINHVKILRWTKFFTGWVCISFLHGNEVLRLIKRRADTFVQNVKFCYKVFVNSKYTRDKALSVASFDNLIMLHPGINPEDFSEERISDLRAINGWNEKKIILMLSRLVARKGHCVVIDALSRIVGKYPQVLLLIGGTGPYQSHIENQVQLAGLEKNVIFLGFVPENLKASYYNACDIYCMPSDIDEKAFDVEGFGITFIEAAATGTLAIGTNVGGIPDAVENGKTGFLIEPKDDIQLSELFDKIFSEPLKYEEMKKYARKRAVHEFSWDKQINKIISVVDARYPV